MRRPSATHAQTICNTCADHLQHMRRPSATHAQTLQKQADIRKRMESLKT